MSESPARPPGLVINPTPTPLQFDVQSIFRCHPSASGNPLKTRFLVFANHEIKEVHLPKKTVTKSGLVVVQQKGTDPSAAAAAAVTMLVNGRKPFFDEDLITKKNFSSTSKVSKLFLKHEVTMLTSRAQTTDELRKLIAKNGSAIVTVKSPSFGGPRIVVLDRLDKTGEADIRDPYHGWSITLHKGVFAKYFYPPKENKEKLFCEGSIVQARIKEPLIPSI